MLRLHEAATRLGISKFTLRKWATEGPPSSHLISLHSTPLSQRSSLEWVTNDKVDWFLKPAQENLLISGAITYMVDTDIIIKAQHLYDTISPKADTYAIVEPCTIDAAPATEVSLQFYDLCLGSYLVLFGLNWSDV
jgi:hypothetical protein